MTNKQKTTNYSNTPYDDVYRTMLNDCPGLIIPVVNEMFGTQHGTEEKITVLNNTLFLNMPNGSQSERITDSNFQIENQRYHIECQSTIDGSILLRIFEYDAQIALSEAVVSRGRMKVIFPRTALLYLRKHKNTPDHMRIEIEVPGDRCCYQIPIMKVQDYSIDEIFEKKLYFLIPFYIFTYEKDLGEYNKKEEKRQELVQNYESLLNSLEQVTRQGIINELMKRTIMDMSQKVILHLSRRYDKVKERLGEIMGGQILDYEAKEIFRSGLAEGMERGIENGQLLQLISLVEKEIISIEVAAQEAHMKEEEFLTRMQMRTDSVLECDRYNIGERTE